MNIHKILNTNIYSDIHLCHILCTNILGHSLVEIFWYKYIRIFLRVKMFTNVTLWYNTIQYKLYILKSLFSGWGGSFHPWLRNCEGLLKFRTTFTGGLARGGMGTRRYCLRQITIYIPAHELLPQRTPLSIFTFKDKWNIFCRMSLINHSGFYQNKT